MKKVAASSILLAGILLAVAVLAEAQQAKRMPRIGYLSAAAPAVAAPLIEAFREGLRQLGYIEGKNIVIEWRYAEGSTERLAEFAVELVGLNVEVIVTASTPAIRAVQQATKLIPIVMANVGDPIAQGFVTNRARPGGNITGFTNLSPDLGTKRLLNPISNYRVASGLADEISWPRYKEWNHAEGKSMDVTIRSHRVIQRIEYLSPCHDFVTEQSFACNKSGFNSSNFQSSLNTQVVVLNDAEVTFQRPVT